MAFKWRSGDVNSTLRRRPVVGGTDSDGATIFVGRAEHMGVNLPCKIMPSKNSAYVSYNGVEVPVHHFEYISGKEKYVRWRPGSNGGVPQDAVSTGSENGEALFVGRAPWDGSLTVGKIHPSHGCIYIPYGGEEIRLTEYEVLVFKEKRRLFGGRDSSSDSD